MFYCRFQLVNLEIVEGGGLFLMMMMITFLEILSLFNTNNIFEELTLL